MFQGVPLKRYIIQETTENRVTFYFRSPREGNYYITVFAQQVNISSCFTLCFWYICLLAVNIIKVLTAVSFSHIF